MVKNKLLVTNNLIGNRISVSMIQRESSLFSSSLSEMFAQKLRLEGNQQNTCHVTAQYDEASFAHLEDLGRQTIGNLLPDEGDLFSGGTDELNIKSDKGDEMEDYDLFSAIGGMELEGNHQSCAGQRNADPLDVVLDGEVGFSTSTVGHLCVGHPSRMLFVRNIDSHVKDSELKGLFEKYGDIRSLYTACKHRGFVLISYFDIRAAENAMRTLKNEPLRRRKLDIHYCVPKGILSEKDIHHGTLVVTDLDHSVSSDELQEMLGGFGDIKEIFKIQKSDHKYVEYYDIRAAEAALCVLNRGNIAGKHIKIEPVHPRVTSLVSSFGQENKTTIFRSPMNGISPGQNVYPGSIASACLDNGFARDFNTVVGSPMSSFTESLRSSSAPTGLSLHASATPIHMQSSFKEQNRYLDHINLGNQPLLNLHPQSLLVYPDTLTNKFPCNSSTSITDIPHSIGIRMIEGSSHIWGVKSNATLMEATGAMFGPSGNGGRPSQPTNYIWSNSSPRKHHPSNSMHRQSSYPFVNKDLAEHLVNVNAFQSASALLNARSGIHHIGSAPPVSSYFWDGQQTYTGVSPDVSRFDSGSLGSMAFPGSSPSHSDSVVEITSQNFVSHIGDMAKNGVAHVPHQICHLFSGRNPIISMPASLDSPNGHLRNFLYRRNEVNSNGADNKQYELNIDRIIRGEDFRTTLMIKNIPNKYNSKMLLAAIDEHCRGTYDFVYLPIDFKNKCNVGYAFINIINSPQIIPFYKAFNGKKWEKFNSEKVAYLAYARIQGKAALIAHFQNSSLMNEDKRCRPILFHTDGPNAGDQEPFPMGTNIRAQPGRSRASLNEVNCQDGFSTSENGLESSGWTRSSLGIANYTN